MYSFRPVYERSGGFGWVRCQAGAIDVIDLIVISSDSGLLVVPAVVGLIQGEGRRFSLPSEVLLNNILHRAYLDRVAGAVMHSCITNHWVTVRGMYTVYTPIQMDIKIHIRELPGPRPLRRGVHTAKIGYWHPSTTDIYISS